MPSGTVYLVGAGPGDPGLITVKGRQCIERADVVVYDYLSNSELLAWAQPDAELIYAGKKSKHHTISQKGINALLVEKAQAGKTVCRLKGGDPMIFGRGGEEAQELREAGIAFEIVPGISSSIAGPIYAGIPVTHRDHCSQLTIFTGHENPEKEESSLDFKKIAQADGTKVMLMGVERIRVITDSLAREGLATETPVGLVRWATTGGQETLIGTLADIANQVESTGFKAPAICVIGSVVNLRKELNWFEERPLFGKRVVVTRTRKQAGSLSAQLRDLGADVIELPTIRTDPPQDLLAFGQLVQDSHGYDWIIFTSPNGVERFFDLFYKIYDDARELGGAKIAAIGPSTAARIKEYHFAVDLMPEEAVAESLADSLENLGSIENLRMLLVRPESARDVIASRLNAKGAILDEGIAYRTVAETEDRTGAIDRLREEGADIITFTSSSTVEHFLELKVPLPKGIKIASIGPVTTKTLKANGLKVAVEAEQHDIPGLIAAVLKLAE